MRLINLHGDPSEAAEHLERFERAQQRKEAGTGCDSCAHCVNAWGKDYCMVNETHPACVHRGKYERAE